MGVPSAQAMIRFAVIDADAGFTRVLSKRIEAVGWQFRVLTGPVPVDELVALRLNALAIDLALLGPRAWDFLEEVARTLPGLGIVVCTGRSTVAQRVRGLRLGADDWIGKPCHPEELIARVEAVARRRKRAGAARAAVPIGAGELEIRADRFQAFVAGRAVDLTRREFELLHLLAEAEGQVMQREDIYQRVWGYAMAHGDRSVDVFVRKIRQKLERLSPSWRYIHTHFGVGYRFEAEPIDDDSGGQIGGGDVGDPVETDAEPAPGATRSKGREKTTKTGRASEASELRAFSGLDGDGVPRLALRGVRL